MGVSVKLQRIIWSKWLYYCLTAIFLIVFGWKIIPYLVENGIINIDLGFNLQSETFGIIFTLLMLVVVLELREQLRWRKVKEKVFDRISIQLRSLFIQLTHFVEFTWSSKPYSILEELKSKQSLAFSKEGMQTLNDKNLSRVLENRMIGFGELEERYYRFLESELELSLMEIQRLLRRLRDGMIQYQNLATRKFVSEEFQQKELLSITHAIIKEIGKIHDLGLDFWIRG